MNPRRETDRRLRQWLRDHYSVIGYSEALDLGASPDLIKYKAGTGEWQRMYRGVYRASAAPTGPHQDLRAAWLTTEGRGVASHVSAAWLWGLTRSPPKKPELTVRRGAHDARGQQRFTVHHSRDIDASVVVTCAGIPATNPLRTLVDLASVALPEELTEAVDRALARRLLTVPGLEAEVNRLSKPGRDGVAVLRRHLAERGFTGAPLPSVLEAHARRLVFRSGLTMPRVEVRAGDDGQYRLDMAWDAILFAVEFDGYVWHFSPEHMRRDQDRRNHLQQAGWTVLVYTWQDLTKEPSRVLDEITRIYRRLSEPPGGPASNR